jgi:hypothetical protein
MKNILGIIIIMLLPQILLAKIYPGEYKCYSGDRSSKFILSSQKDGDNLLYQRGTKQYKGKWENSFNDAELTLTLKKMTNFSSSKPRTIEYLLSPAENEDPSQFVIYKMNTGQKKLFCYASGILEIVEEKEKTNTNQQIIINNINYNN